MQLLPSLCWRADQEASGEAPEQEPSDFDSEVPLAVVLDDRLEVRFELFKSLQSHHSVLFDVLCLFRSASELLQLCCNHLTEASA